MQVYAVAVLSHFENVNRVHILQSDTEINAIKRALLFHTIEECKNNWVNKSDPTDQELEGLKESKRYLDDWLATISENISVEDFLIAVHNTEISVSLPVQINYPC